MVAAKPLRCDGVVCYRRRGVWWEVGVEDYLNAESCCRVMARNWLCRHRCFDEKPQKAVMIFQYLIILSLVMLTRDCTFRLTDITDSLCWLLSLCVIGTLCFSISHHPVDVTHGYSCYSAEVASLKWVFHYIMNSVMTVMAGPNYTMKVFLHTKEVF